MSVVAFPEATVRVLERVVTPFTLSVLDSVVAPDTSSVPLIIVLDNVVVPATPRVPVLDVFLNVASPVIDILLNVAKPVTFIVPLTSSVAWGFIFAIPTLLFTIAMSDPYGGMFKSPPVIKLIPAYPAI